MFHSSLELIKKKLGGISDRVDDARRTEGNQIQVASEILDDIQGVVADLEVGSRCSNWVSELTFR